MTRGWAGHPIWRTAQHYALLSGVLLMPIVAAGQGVPKARVETLTPEGTVWTASTWGYTSPKLLWDGERAYAVGLVGEGPGKDVARLYWRDRQGWHPGADITPVYQPATLLLDAVGHIHLWCTDRGERGYHWRSVRPHDVTAFEPDELPEARKFGYGYLGVGRDGELMALAGLAQDYSMWLTVQPGKGRPWIKPVLICRSESRTAPVKAPLYPVVLPHGDVVDVIYSFCPDGSVHNTYDRVEWVRYDVAQGKLVRHEIVAQGPLGEVTYGVDALRAVDGTLYSVYMGGNYRYGEKRPDIDQRQGLWCAALGSDGEWRTHRITKSTGTGQLVQGPDRALHLFESASNGTRHYRSADGGRTWSAVVPELVWDQPGFFLYAIKPNSGSVIDGILRAVQSKIDTNVPKGTVGKYSLEYIERPW